MNLSEVLTSVAHKVLVAVDLPHAGSNQHELNAVAALKELFGTGETTRGTLEWFYFSDDDEPQREDGWFTFYDARAKSAARTGRSEWRFYYGGDFLSRAQIGDWLVLARTTDGRDLVLVFQRESAWCRAAQVLLGSPKSQSSFGAIPQDDLEAKQLEFLSQRILDELGLDLHLPIPPSDEDLVVAKFGKEFPTTRVMSEFARSQAIADHLNPDDTLARWLEREEQLFRALENTIIRERLASNFASVDDFIQYSLSVQNRRKSRMGHALQNHLAELFRRLDLQFTPQARTEANSRPDFIFPGETQYQEASFEASLLTMLGVKSTSKDRWRQVLTEADRIPRKHLCTLEAGISVKQTNEMVRQQLTLVVPSGLHPTYTTTQREGILSIAQFAELVRSKQK